MLPTRDHEEIRRWATRNDASPAEIKPILFDSEPSILYFLFGEAKSGTPEIVPISWQDFFARFDLMNLSIVLDERTPQFEIVREEKSSAKSLSN